LGSALTVERAEGIQKSKIRSKKRSRKRIKNRIKSTSRTGALPGFSSS
jgi:hypothetical protein